MLHWSLAACLGFGMSAGSAFLLILSLSCPFVRKLLEYQAHVLAPICRRLSRCERADDDRFQSQALTERSTGTRASCTFVGAPGDHGLSPYNANIPAPLREMPRNNEIAIAETQNGYNATHHDVLSCLPIITHRPVLYGLILVFFAFVLLWTLFRLLFFIWIMNASFESFKKIKAVSSLSTTEVNLAILHMQWSIPTVTSNASRIMTIGALSDCAQLGIALSIIPLLCELDRSYKETRLPRNVVNNLYNPCNCRSLAKYFAGATTLIAIVFTIKQMSLAHSSKKSSSASLWCSILVHWVHIFLTIYGIQFLNAIKNRCKILTQVNYTVPTLCRCILRLLMFSLAASTPYYVSYGIAFFQSNTSTMLVNVLFIPSLVLQSFSGMLMVSIVAISPICWYSHKAFPLYLCQKAQVQLREDISYADPPICPHCKAPIDSFSEKDAIFVSAVYSHVDGSTLHSNVTNKYVGVLRALLTLHKGHEIGISEKGLRLAFHSIRDAVEYCFQVEHEWNYVSVPFRKICEDIVAGTEDFLMLPMAMQMAVYDANCTDEQMLHEIHLVFKKHLIKGQMEDVRRSTSYFAGNRLIVVTQHIAEWLHSNSKSISEPFSMHYIGSCDILHRSQSTIARSFKLYRLGSRTNQSTSESIISKVFEATSSLTEFQDLNSPRMTSYTLFDNAGLSWDASIPVLSSVESKILPITSISPACSSLEEWGIIRASNTCSIPMLSSPAAIDDVSETNDQRLNGASPDDYQNIVVFKLFAKRSQRRISQMIFL